LVLLYGEFGFDDLLFAETSKESAKMKQKVDDKLSHETRRFAMEVYKIIINLLFVEPFICKQ